jgi:D-cysteine desulfhydrase family pyridoxal phosphate-dependent enzyme
VVRHDLCEEELSVRVLVQQVSDLADRVTVWIRPAPERKIGHALTNLLSQLPGMRDAAWRAKALVTAEHNECAEPVVVGAIRIGEAVINRVLAREKRHDARSRDVGPEIDDQVSEVVLFPRTDRTVGKEDERAAARKASHRVVGVDPGVHAGGRFELRARWPQLRGNHTGLGLQAFHKGGQLAQYTERFMFGALPTLPTVPLAPAPTPVEDMPRLAAALGGTARLLVKRDDAIGFAFGGNKVRKMRYVAAEALKAKADVLITSGGVQSNHARVTAAAAAKLGLKCVLVVNGAPPERLTANALLDRLLGAEVRYVAAREERVPAMEEAAAELRRAGCRPFVIPIGASTPLGAVGYVRAVEELLGQIDPPDVIVHATSSGGTQAGLAAGCALAGMPTRVVGVSADEPSAALERDIRRILEGLKPLLQVESDLSAVPLEVDDRFVGPGYGVPTDQSHEAIDLTARTEAIFLDHTYTAKAMAALIAAVRSGEFSRQTVLFWHTGGHVGLFS